MTVSNWYTLERGNWSKEAIIAAGVGFFLLAKRRRILRVLSAAGTLLPTKPP